MCDSGSQWSVVLIYWCRPTKLFWLPVVHCIEEYFTVHLEELLDVFFGGVPQVFEDFLSWFYYRNPTSFIYMENVKGVWRLAQEYQVECCMNACSRFLASNVMTNSPLAIDHINFLAMTPVEFYDSVSRSFEEGNSQYAARDDQDAHRFDIDH